MRLTADGTFSSHRLIQWTADSGRHMDVLDSIFRRGLEKGDDVGDHRVLSECAAEVPHFCHGDVVIRAMCISRKQV